MHLPAQITFWQSGTPPAKRNTSDSYSLLAAYSSYRGPLACLLSVSTNHHIEIIAAQNEACASDHVPAY